MLRIRNCFYFIKHLPIENASFHVNVLRRVSHLKLPLRNTQRPLLIAKQSFSSDGGKKVCDDPNDPSVKSHPTSTIKSQLKSLSENIRLKKCTTTEINPLKSSLSMEMGIPAAKECMPDNELSKLPQPGGSWNKNQEKTNKTNRNWFIFGTLLSAVSVGVLYYVLSNRTSTKEKSKPKPTKKQVIFKDPPTSADIPKEVPYLLIGGGTSSFSAFRAIKSSDPTAKVLIISKEAYFPYMRPPLSKEIWFNDDLESIKNLTFKQWNGNERSLLYEPEDFYISCKQLLGSENGGVAIARGWTITHLDVMKKLAYLDDGEAIQYNKCLIATGATPRLAPVFEIAITDEKLTNRIKIFRNIDDFKDVYESFQKSKSVAIVGGGFLGSELACAMGRTGKTKGKTVYQLFRENGNMGKILPEYLSFWTMDKVRNEGVNIIPSTEIVGVKSKDGLVELQLNSGKALLVDFVIVAVGVEANTELAKKSDLEVDPDVGGFLVNTELQARTDLYIAGDCSCFYDPKLGRRRIEHHDHAVVSGRLAGENMAGNRRPYDHQSMFWSDLGPEVGFEAIGIVDSSLPTVGVFAKATDKDTPQAAAEQNDATDRLKMEEIPEECEKYLSEENKEKLKKAKQLLPNPEEGEDYGRGVIFYLRDDIVVGIVLWNVFNRISIARQVIQEGRKYDDLNEVAKLFNIHSDEE